MNRVIVWIILLSLLVSTPVLAVTYTVRSIKGIVEVRHGISEIWVSLKVGEELKPDDTIRTGKGAAAVISVNGGKKIHIPELTIVELVDLRPIDRDELILKLTMEFIRGIPSDSRDGGLQTPSTTIVHGTPPSRDSTAVGDKSIGLMLMNGTRVLFDHEFYGTCVLRAKEVFRIYPDLQREIDHRSLVAHALEKLGLKREALNEYLSMRSESLNAEERAHVDRIIERIKKELQ